MTSRKSKPWFEVRNSRVHGRGCFARRAIPKGTRIIEYTGERVSPDEADRRYDEDVMDIPHTFLFTVDKKTIIDAGRRGNAARWINHSCAPNCETTDEDGRIFVEAMRDIRRGEELSYNYNLQYEGRYEAAWKERYACRCGAKNCKKTMLFPKKRRKRPKRSA
ncbi:MAG: SET domain-containing protein-lysine N-methyltransferase [candidate division Zixibacteria bacterium]|nr:SET domain-containing protein-lysine N-methyltransferase [candidate division Zixibacteria bacterium]